VWRHRTFVNLYDASNDSSHGGGAVVHEVRSQLEALERDRAKARRDSAAIAREVPRVHTFDAAADDSAPNAAAPAAAAAGPGGAMARVNPEMSRSFSKLKAALVDRKRAAASSKTADSDTAASAARVEAAVAPTAGSAAPSPQAVPPAASQSSERNALKTHVSPVQSAVSLPASVRTVFSQVANRPFYFNTETNVGSFDVGVVIGSTPDTNYPVAAASAPAASAAASAATALGGASEARVGEGARASAMGEKTMAPGAIVDISAASDVVFIDPASQTRKSPGRGRTASVASNDGKRKAPALTGSEPAARRSRRPADDLAAAEPAQSARVDSRIGWACKVCTLVNRSRDKTCSACSASRDSLQ
jgi:hypothetical protein